jgi:hypothetical protein
VVGVKDPSTVNAVAVVVARNPRNLGRSITLFPGSLVLLRDLQTLLLYTFRAKLAKSWAGDT